MTMKSTVQENIIYYQNRDFAVPMILLKYFVQFTYSFCCIYYLSLFSWGDREIKFFKVKGIIWKKEQKPKNQQPTKKQSSEKIYLHFQENRQLVVQTYPLSLGQEFGAPQPNMGNAFLSPAMHSWLLDPGSWSQCNRALPGWQFYSYGHLMLLLQDFLKNSKCKEATKAECFSIWPK